MERTILETLIAQLTESIEFNRRFGVVKPDVSVKIVNDIAAEILTCKDLQPSLNRDFLNAFDELIVTFCQSKLRLHPSLFGRHLSNVRMVTDRNKAKSTCEFESVEWYLAILGLTIESDPRSILSAFRSVSESDSSSRRLFDQLHGGEPRTEVEVLAIRNLVTGRLDSVRGYRKSLQKTAKPDEKRRKALDGEYCFSSYFKQLAAQLQVPTKHPALNNVVKSAVCSLATGSDSRTSALRAGDQPRIRACFQALIFVHQEGLNIPLTAVCRCVSAYILRPELNTNPESLNKMRELLETRHSVLSSLVSNAVRESLCDTTKGTNSAFPDPMEVCMAYSYLNLPLYDRQMYSEEEVSAAAQTARSGLTKPHTGQYRSPHIHSDLYSNWIENHVMALKKASRALENAMTRVNCV